MTNKEAIRIVGKKKVTRVNVIFFTSDFEKIGNNCGIYGRNWTLARKEDEFYITGERNLPRFENFQNCGV